jgi:hypothetical protein
LRLHSIARKIGVPAPQLPRQPLASIETHLHVEGKPGLDPGIHEAKAWVHEVLVDVQALTWSQLQPALLEDGVRGLSSGAAPRGPRCGRARARSRSDVATEGPLARVDLVEDVLRAGAGWPRPRDPLLGPAPGVRHGAEEACSLIGLAPSDCFRGRGPQAEIDRRCWSLPYADGEMGSY